MGFSNYPLPPEHQFATHTVRTLRRGALPIDVHPCRFRWTRYYPYPVPIDKAASAGHAQGVNLRLYRAK